MFRKALLTLSVSAALGMPTAALAQFGPPPGPPPGLGGPPPGLGGPPPGPGGSAPGIGGLRGGPPRAGLGVQPPHAGGGGAPRFSGLDGARGRGLESNFRASEGRSATFASRSSAYGYARSGSVSSRYGYGRGRYRYWPEAAYAYGSSYESSGCYYTSVYRRGRYRRVVSCSED